MMSLARVGIKGVTVTPGVADIVLEASETDARVTVLGDADLLTGNVRNTANIFGVPGKDSVVETDDATATATDILSGKSAYVNGVKLAGTNLYAVGRTIDPASLGLKSPLPYKTHALGQWAYDPKLLNGYMYAANSTLHRLLKLDQNTMQILATATISATSDYWDGYFMAPDGCIYVMSRTSASPDTIWLYKINAAHIYASTLQVTTGDADGFILFMHFDATYLYVIQDLNSINFRIWRVTLATFGDPNVVGSTWGIGGSSYAQRGQYIYYQPTSTPTNIEKRDVTTGNLISTYVGIIGSNTPFYVDSDENIYVWTSATGVLQKKNTAGEVLWTADTTSNDTSPTLEFSTNYVFIKGQDNITKINRSTGAIIFSTVYEAHDYIECRGVVYRESDDNCIGIVDNSSSVAVMGKLLSKLTIS